MDNSRDPRIQIYTNLDHVQKDMEDAAKERKDEIKKEAKEQIKDIKSEMKDLKQAAKDSFEQYRSEKENSGDPLASEKISTAREATKVVTKDIENDYETTKDQIERETDHRINSIENMLDDSNNKD